jgi:hypothetical protein
MKAKITTSEKQITYDLSLTMTEREARALLAVFRNIGGLPTGPREVTDELYTALYSVVGLKKGYRVSGSVCFPDTWTEFEGASE